MRIHATACMGGIVMTNNKFQVELARYKYWLSTKPPMNEVRVKSDKLLRQLDKTKNGKRNDNLIRTLQQSDQ